MFSSNSVADRIKALMETNAPQAQALELDRLRTNYGPLKDAYNQALQEVTRLRATLARYEGELRVLLDFITSSGVALTDPVANVIATREEQRVVNGM